MFSRIGADAIKTDIKNTVEICAHIGNPQLAFKSVHVAGTNGKGSTSHMLAAIFQAAGYKTALYTSPHLRDFRERIKINGNMIPESEVIDFTEKMIPIIKQIQPSFFEITVAMAFEYFAREKVDIAIVEVGLGGRLDSTNIIKPELSIITNIGWDHMNILGDSIQKIAIEKAGIIKQNIPVVIGEHQDIPAEVFKQKAEAQQAPLSFASLKFTVFDWKFEKNELVAEVTKLHTDEKWKYKLDLPGLYQTKNLVTVLEAVHILRKQGWAITEKHLEKGLSEVKKLTGLHGRWEKVHQHPDVVLDVAHNEDGIRELKSQLELTTFHHLHIVIGMVKDKEVHKVLALLPKVATYYFTRAQIPRALPEQQLQAFAQTVALKGDCYPDVNSAVLAAMSNAAKDDLVLICGSVFIVGELDHHQLDQKR